MDTTNILICGVGGQGLVLTTKILAEAAFEEDYDLKTSDVIGLSQRGGMVWGSVRFGKKIYSALIPDGEADILLAMEELEGLRWSSSLKTGGKVILNEHKTFPNRILIEKEEYPESINETLVNKGFEIFSVNANKAAKGLNNIKVVNLVLLGKLSTFLSLSLSTWEKVIEKNVPPSTVDLNKKAFMLGRTL
ncbi:indolepyruvate oxidoreductase subunit beta [Clostridium rhizosphaerae]|uniref:indolepyruvate oxidoreductase subunit beta n=1 Tax=Clostridium rhizosphaerae TaxID=2803861 RepID=UPI001FAF6C22|nr:indolepyruvate oxidoreductase subunit beta [Clostridium rhizosphaerae]